MRRYFVAGSCLFFFTACAGWSGVCDNHACDSDASLGDGGDAGPDAPPGCNPSADPKDSPACVADGFGIFVDATNGSDGNAGTKEAPMKSIAAALGKTDAQHARLYVCDGTYPEDVVVDASHDGVSIYGGWKCSAWSYDGNKPTVGKSKLALKLESLTQAITIADVLVKASNGTQPGDTSIAALVGNCAGVTFLRTNLTAGMGVTGANGGTPSSNYNASLVQTDASIAGHNASGATGGAVQQCTGLCVDNNASTGGQGGAGGAAPGDGSNGAPALPENPTGKTPPHDGKKGLAGCTNGDPGADAPSAANAPLPATLGTLSSSGWLATSGANAANGGPGQGGGGGGGAMLAGAGGGAGGGCGGCGGAGGEGGGGGGGSIALASFSSVVTLTQSELHAGAAGDGGNGTAGEDGQLGGITGSSSVPGCLGGTGGKGGAGGAGAGGAGGVSLGVLWKGGSAPTLDSSTQAAITIATKGAKGAGGAAGQNDGIDGVAQPVMQAP